MVTAGDRRKAPSVSVITVTLNCAESLGLLKRSLLAQSDDDFEWVVVDGGSRDRTLDIAREFPAPRLKLVSEPDFGIYHALNKAVDMANADYYLVVGSDDELYPESIHQFRLAATQTGADIVAASVMIRGREVRPLMGARWLRGGNAYVASHAVGSLFKRDMHQRYGYYSNRYVNAADMYFVLTAARQHAVIVRGDFIAGCFACEGVSTVDRNCSITEAFRVQVNLGENKLVQLLLLMFRLIRAAYADGPAAGKSVRGSRTSD